MNVGGQWDRKRVWMGSKSERVWMGSKSERECGWGARVREKERKGINFIGGYLPVFFNIVLLTSRNHFRAFFFKSGALMRAS